MVLRKFMRSKIHRATVTDVNINYIGSVSVDSALMEAAGIGEWEQVHVLDISNGVRLVTYAIPGDVGQVCINGAAAKLIEAGDIVIILTYADYTPDELAGVEPTVVHVDEKNRPVVV